MINIAINYTVLRNIWYRLEERSLIMFDWKLIQLGLGRVGQITKVERTCDMENRDCDIEQKGDTTTEISWKFH